MWGMPTVYETSKENAMLKIKTEQVIGVSDWDRLVRNTYGRKYSFQQQDGCMARQRYRLTIPCDEADDFENDDIPEEVNGAERGVSFAEWLARDPEQDFKEGETRGHQLDLFWHRNFYPDISMVANDLHARGLIPAGTYVIDIDW